MRDTLPTAASTARPARPGRWSPGPGPGTLTSRQRAAWSALIDAEYSTVHKQLAVFACGKAFVLLPWVESACALFAVHDEVQMDVNETRRKRGI